MVQLTVTLPDQVAEHFGATPEVAARRLLESAAVEGYRSQFLSRWQVRQMLGLSWYETEEFLAHHKCYRHYTPADLEEDWQTLSKMFPA